MKTYTALLACVAAVANAHMIMKTPVPAGNPDSSPLDPAGGDFPCKGLTSVADGQKNVMNVGASNTLSFTGSAVHGGGSCQVSIAKGTAVTKDMKFMVIHSIEGGCPANVAGNLPADPNGSGAATFQFSIPDHPDLPTGEEYTLAWTWNNKIGNREFYMNCARVELQGASKKRYAPSNMPVSKRQQAPLPAMFVANIGNGCSTAEGIDVRYPDPGASLETASNANLGDPTGNCGAVGAANPPSNSPPSGSSASPPVASASSVAASSAPAFASSAPAFASSAPAFSNSVNPVAPSATAIRSGNPGQFTQTAPGVFATESAAASTSVATQAPVASSAVAATPASSAAAPVGTGTGSSTTPSTGTCEVGAWDCAADGKSFTRCVAGGTWSAPINMAEGMTCTPGVSMNFAYNASVGTHAKRDMRSHVARRRHMVHGSALS